MKKRVSMLLAVLRGEAIVIVKSPEGSQMVDVLVGTYVTKRDAVNRVASTLKALAL